LLVACCLLLVSGCSCRSLRAEILICYHRELLLVRGATGDSGDTKPVDTCNCQIFFGNLHATIAILTFTYIMTIFCNMDLCSWIINNYTSNWILLLPYLLLMHINYQHTMEKIRCPPTSDRTFFPAKLFKMWNSLLTFKGWNAKHLEWELVISKWHLVKLKRVGNN